MTPEHRLVVALSGRDEDAALIRYANALAALNRGAARPVRSQARRAASSAAPTVMEQDEEGLVLSTPQAVEFVEISSDRSIEPVLALAAEPGTGAVLVGEAFRRRQLRALVQRAACSVWFIPEGAASGIRRILTPVDFSIASADCLRVATVLARLSAAAECLALHVYFNSSMLANPEEDRTLRRELAEAYARFVMPIDTLAVKVTPLFQEAADVAGAINRAAVEQDADLIVLASRGRTWAGGLLDESIAERTLRDCRTPLLVVKHFGAQLGLLGVLREGAVARGNEPRFN